VHAASDGSGANLGQLPTVPGTTSYNFGQPPAEDPAPRDRLPSRALIHREKYQKPTPEMVSDFYHEREVKGWERYMADDKLRKLVTESGVQNLAQVYTQLKYTKESHITYSQDVLRCLRQQNFLN
jgi:hypothetical protein